MQVTSSNLPFHRMTIFFFPLCHLPIEYRTLYFEIYILFTNTLDTALMKHTSCSILHGKYTAVIDEGPLPCHSSPSLAVRLSSSVKLRLLGGFCLPPPNLRCDMKTLSWNFAISYTCLPLVLQKYILLVLFGVIK